MLIDCFVLFQKTWRNSQVYSPFFYFPSLFKIEMPPTHPWGFYWLWKPNRNQPVGWFSPQWMCMTLKYRTAHIHLQETFQTLRSTYCPSCLVIVWGLHVQTAAFNKKCVTCVCVCVWAAIKAVPDLNLESDVKLEKLESFLGKINSKGTSYSKLRLTNC